MTEVCKAPSSRMRAVAFAATLAAFAVGTPLQADVVRAVPEGFVVRHETTVSASPKDVWLALTSPAGWWTPEHTWSGKSANLTLTPQAGGCFCETIPEVDEPGRFTLEGSVEHMRVIQAYPERALRMQGALGPLQSEPVVGILTIAISKVGEGTRIVWEYNVGGAMRFEVPVIAKAVDGVIGLQAAALAKGLRPVASGPSAPAPKAPAPSSAAPKASEPKAGGPADASTPGAAAPKAAAPARPSLNPKAPAAKPTDAANKVDDAFGDLKDD